MQSTTLVDGYACFSLAWYTQRKKKGEEQLMCGIGASVSRGYHKWCTFGQKTKTKVHHRSSQLLWEILFCNWKKKQILLLFSFFLLNKKIFFFHAYFHIGAKLIRICECNGRNDLTVRVQATEKNGWCLLAARLRVKGTTPVRKLHGISLRPLTLCLPCMWAVVAGADGGNCAASEWFCRHSSLTEGAEYANQKIVKEKRRRKDANQNVHLCLY